VLFPIVGRLRDDTLVHQGRDYKLTQHGFGDRIWQARYEELASVVDRHLVAGLPRGLSSPGLELKFP